MVQVNKRLLLEKQQIRVYFPYLRCQIKGNVLEGKGRVRPTQDCDEYTVYFRFSPPNQPEVYILEPQIEYFEDIHLYPADHPPYPLCLYYPEDHLERNKSALKARWLWPAKLPFGTTIVPWISEWIICYEIWLRTGKWVAPQVHGDVEK